MKLVNRRTYATTGRIGRLVQRAAQLRQRRALIDAQLEPLRKELLDLMLERDLTELVSGDTKVRRKVRHQWNYSPETAAEALDLRQRQLWEQQEGVASDSPRHYVALESV